MTRDSIVVVHGLAAHPLGSFRSRKGNEVWIRDFLPSDVPSARVLLYGYDSQLVKSSPKVSIGDLAKALVEEVVTFRRETSVGHRHSLLTHHIILIIEPAAAESANIHRSQPRRSSGQKGTNIHIRYSLLPSAKSE